MPAARLSSQQNVLLIASLSRTGDVKAASGDIEAAAVAGRHQRQGADHADLEPVGSMTEFIPPGTRFHALSSPFRDEAGEALDDARDRLRNLGPA